jgi:hypothetical protein
MFVFVSYVCDCSEADDPDLACDDKIDCTIDKCQEGTCTHTQLDEGQFHIFFAVVCVVLVFKTCCFGGRCGVSVGVAR